VRVSSQFELNNHADSATPCQPRARQLKDGFTFEIYERLHNKKKQFLGQSQGDRWREIYELLFPSVESVPNPCEFNLENANIIICNRYLLLYSRRS
jgi:hypothetical protein